MAPKDENIPSRASIDRCGRLLFTPMALRAALQLEIFTALADGPKTSSELAAALGVGQRRLDPVLYQLVLGDFLELSDDRFGNSDVADTYLVVGRPSYIGSIHELWTEQWTNMLKIADGVRTGRPQAKIDFDAMSPEQLAGFIRGLHGTTVAAGKALGNLHDFSKARRVADVGGGSGGISVALCQEYPDLSATLYELPSIVPIAREVIAEAGLAERIAVETADVLAAPLAGEFDVIVAKALFQVMSADDARKAVRNVGAALSRGGTFHIIGFILDDTRLSPEVCVGANLMFINMFDDAAAYTEAQYRDWLTEAGFVDIERQPIALPPGASMLTARKA